MIINLKTRIIKLGKYQKLKILIDVIARIQFHFERTLYNKFSIIITSNIITKIYMAYNDIISKNRDFLFELNCFQDFEFINKILIYVINFTILMILVYNVMIIFVRLFRKAKLETLFEYK